MKYISMLSEGCLQARSNLHNAVAQIGQAALPQSGQRCTTKLPESERGCAKFFETARPLSGRQGSGKLG